MLLKNRHNLSDIKFLLKSGEKISLSAEAKERIEKCHRYLRKKIEKNEEPIYGINTGFGSLYNQHIGKEDLRQLQLNLLRSHACGMGDEVPEDIVRIMLLLKAQSLSYGHSGVQLKTVEKLLDLLNSGHHPVVYELGSLGASGDLAPLAHLCLPLIGEGEIRINGQKTLSSSHIKDPVQLGPKEGLALINGTQFMQAYGIYCLIKAQNILDWADKLAAISLDAYDGRIEPFLQNSHLIRPHKGQVETAETIFKLLEGSEIIKQVKSHVQDPYSFRCVPQVHGASKDVVKYTLSVLETEINSVTDNPNVFPEEDLILSAGNFHGQPLALSLDFLAIALSEIAAISERRVYRLLEGKRGLPAFLTSNPGLQSGLMIAQYTAAGIVSQNKQLCTPASIDSLESSNGQEDHVSMGANAATKCLRVVENVERVLAIEWLTATRALAFRKPLKSSEILEKLKKQAEDSCDCSDRDIILAAEMEKLRLVISTVL